MTNNQKKRMCYNKNSYETFDGALFYARTFNSRIYKCPICQKFHLTTNLNGARNISELRQK